MSQRRTGRSRREPLRRQEPATYARVSMRPLHVLVFLAPLLVAYEIGAAVYLKAETIRAHTMFSSFFGAMGVGGLHLPAIVMVVVLLVWHIMRRDEWKVRPGVLLGMLVESVAWKLPLLVFASLVQGARARPPSAALAGAATGDGAAVFAALDLPQRAVIAVGAGLYEELLFRMVGVALVHFVAADLLKLGHRVAGTAAVVLTAIAFAWHHDAWRAGAVDMRLFTFYLVAGLYFGALYVLRGFGIVVMTHALYDLVVLLHK